MILCVTPNPAIDCTLVVPRLRPGEVHRASHSLAAAGGKGLNVARAIRTLGGEPLCAGFVGGHGGRLLAELAEREGLRGAWTWIEGETRTCVILVEDGGPERDATVVNDNGPTVSADDWTRLQADVARASAQAGIVCVSGSLPPSSPLDNFTALLQSLVQAGKQAWVDTGGAALEAALPVRGVSIKVNLGEAGAVLGQPVGGIAEAAQAAKTLRDRGEAFVARRRCYAPAFAVLTLGAEGAVMAGEDGCWHAQPTPVKVVSTAGSGDAFLGALAVALSGATTPPEALRQAVAAGVANALSPGGARFTLEDFRTVLRGTGVVQIA